MSKSKSRDKPAAGALPARGWSGRFGEPLGIAREHRLVGEKMMTESHRLRDLQMSESGHYCPGVLLGEVDQCLAESAQLNGQRIDCAAQP